MYVYYSRSSNTYHDFFGLKEIITLFKGQLQSALYFGINLEQYGFFYMHFFKKYHIAETHKTGKNFFPKMFLLSFKQYFHVFVLAKVFGLNYLLMRF